MRNGQSIRERLTKLGFTSGDDEAVHDALDVLDYMLEDDGRGIETVKAWAKRHHELLRAARDAFALKQERLTGKRP